jgi:hypothetical protein
MFGTRMPNQIMTQSESALTAIINDWRGDGNLQLMK